MGIPLEFQKLDTFSYNTVIPTNIERTGFQVPTEFLSHGKLVPQELILY
jgi:hypothetical protein